MDGEGCFRIVGTTPRLTISNTHLPTLQAIQKEHGGTLYPDRRTNNSTSNRPSFFLAWNGDNAMAMCHKLLPHLREKHDQCSAIITFRTLPKGKSPLKAAMIKELKKMKRPEFYLEKPDAHRFG